MPVSFKEDDAEIIGDQTMYYFTNNPSAGIDEYGRKYSVCWLALASYDETTDTWTYFGKNSTTDKYIGWYYSVEWYNEIGKKIDSDKIRINLSNENCHYMIEDYYMGQYQKKTDSISVSRLINDVDTILVFDGGSADNVII